MNTNRTIIFSLILCFLSKIATANALDITIPLSQDGYQRTYNIHLPPKYNSSIKYPLVFVLHGGGGDANGIQKVTEFNKKADKEGFIVVYPQGIGEAVLGSYAGTWNAGTCCGLAVEKNIDDVGFFRAMIDKLTTSYSIDTERIYSTGLSNGAQMSYRLACELSDKIAAIAPVSSQNVNSTCKQERRVPILHIHGIQDSCAKYQGGMCGGCFEKFTGEVLNIQVNPTLWACSSVPDTIASWQKNNACSSSQIKYLTSKNASCVSFTGCPNRGSVEFCMDQDLGHNWAGGKETLAACDSAPSGKICQAWSSSVGPMSNSLNATDLIWEFFKQHSLSDGTSCVDRDVVFQKLSIKSEFNLMQKIEKRLGRIINKIDNNSYSNKNLLNDKISFASAYTEIPENFITCAKSNCQKIDLSPYSESIFMINKSSYSRIKELNRKIRKSGKIEYINNSKTLIKEAKISYKSIVKLAADIPAYYTNCDE